MDKFMKNVDEFSLWWYNYFTKVIINVDREFMAASIVLLVFSFFVGPKVERPVLVSFTQKPIRIVALMLLCAAFMPESIEFTRILKFSLVDTSVCAALLIYCKDFIIDLLGNPYKTAMAELSKKTQMLGPKDANGKATKKQWEIFQMHMKEALVNKNVFLNVFEKVCHAFLWYFMLSSVINHCWNPQISYQVFKWYLTYILLGNAFSIAQFFAFNLKVFGFNASIEIVNITREKNTLDEMLLSDKVPDAQKPVLEERVKHFEDLLVMYRAENRKEESFEREFGPLVLKVGLGILITFPLILVLKGGAMFSNPILSLLIIGVGVYAYWNPKLREHMIPYHVVEGLFMHEMAHYKKEGESHIGALRAAKAEAESGITQIFEGGRTVKQLHNSNHGFDALIKKATDHYAGKAEEQRDAIFSLFGGKFFLYTAILGNDHEAFNRILDRIKVLPKHRRVALKSWEESHANLMGREAIREYWKIFE